MTERRRSLRIADASAGRSGDPPTLTVDPDSIGPGGIRAIVGQVGPPDSAGRQLVEVVVDGWRFEFVVEDDARADLRERASRDRARHLGAGEPLEIRAIIPGRIASVAVTPGDAVEVGQPLLAVEAMKMQNELRAPRAGSVARVVATAGATVEVGDLLIVLE
jgi:biotin carboxyl carrier protein